MQSEEIRTRFLKFFEGRGHAIIPSTSLVPENDPSVLFNTAGMQPLVPFLLGEKHPSGTKLVGVQKCVRTTDIDEVGDNTHLTFFEMLGNWSLGEYFKEDAIKWSYEFLTSKEEGLGLDPSRLYVTVFEGDNNAPRDDESIKIWESLGVPESHIYPQEVEDNWWSPGDNGPCGPDTEMFYDVTEEGLGDMTLSEFKKADEIQSVVEVWNDVFMEYEKKDGKIIGKLAQKNVDTGAGLERLAVMMQKKDNVYETDLFEGVINKLNKISNIDNLKSKRIVADHLRAAVFMISDDVVPANTDRGYILRRIIRRAVRHLDVLKVSPMEENLKELTSIIINQYSSLYENIKNNKEIILSEMDKEGAQFAKTINKGFDRLKKMKNVSGKDAFILFSTYGLPIEMIEEYAQENNIDIDRVSFDKEMKKHQELSRSGAEQKFKGGLADTDEMSVQYHTATHLLNQALREVLGDHVSQKGSNITSERLRFDFSHSEKMTEDQKKAVEDIVNKKIKEALPVSYRDVTIEEARKIGAIGVFDDKYEDKVRVYQIGNDTTGVFSLEICGGPHVKNTSELGHFKIKKEGASSAGVRRIKAVLE